MYHAVHIPADLKDFGKDERASLNDFLRKFDSEKDIIFHNGRPPRRDLQTLASIHSFVPSDEPVLCFLLTKSGIVQNLKIKFFFLQFRENQYYPFSFETFENKNTPHVFVIKIPFLKNLTAEHIGKILGLSSAGFYQPGDKIWVGDGRASNEMYILLSGELAVINGEGRRVAAIKPVTTVGELGLKTSQPRSATVEAVQPSNIHVVPKPLFDQLLHDNMEMQVIIYRNVIDVLYNKLVHDNIRKRDQQPAPQKRPAQAAAPPSLPRTYTVDDLKIADLQQSSTQRILVVDDEPKIRNLVRQALSAFEVVEASNGKEALQSIQEKTPDLIITDIKMPEMDGITFLTLLRNQHPDLPVLALSGYVGSEEILPYTFDSFIAKPLKLEEVKEIVVETLANDGND